MSKVIDRHPSCKKRIKEAWASRKQDLRLLWTTYKLGSSKFETLTDLNNRKLALVDSTNPISDKEDLIEDMAVEVDSEAECFVFENLHAVADLGGPDGIYDYGLSFDYVEYNKETKYGNFFRWQLSWGGPSDELQFYVTDSNQLERVEYRFMDWGDGAGMDLVGDDLALVSEIYDWFLESGTIAHLREEVINNA